MSGVRTFRGSGGTKSQLVEVLRTIGGDTKDVQYRLGTVTAVSPINIRVDGTGRDLMGDDLTIAERLAEHKRMATIPGDIGEVVITFEPAIDVGDRVIMLSYATEYGPEYVVIDKVSRAVGPDGA